MRVVTLLPAATEIVAALGVDPVGVSHECDHPPAAAAAPAVTASPVDADASASEIDDQVQTAAEGEGVFAIDRERLAALDPDVVVTQGVCDVCAVDSVLVESVLAELDLDADVVTTDVHDLDDLRETVRTIGRTIGRSDRAEELVADLDERVSAVTERVAASRADDAEPPAVAVLDWLDPVMAAGHWVPELVELAGGRYGLADVGERSRPREWASVREYDPAVLVAAPCGFDVGQTRADLANLTERPGWSELRAVRRDAVWIVDGDALVNRPGPRLVETLEVLAGIVAPDAVEPPSTDLAVRIDPLDPASEPERTR